MIKSILLFAFFISRIGLFGQSQNSKGSDDLHFEIAFSAGISYAKSITEMYNAMVFAGLGDDAYAGNTLYTYPSEEKEFGVLDLSLMYKWNAHSGIVLGVSILERFSLDGRANVTDGVRLKLKTNVYHVRCQYQWRTLNSRFLMAAGPSMTFFNIIDTYPALFWQQHYSSSIVGIAGAVQYNVINQDAFFVSLSINGQYALPTKIGEFRAHKISVPPNAFSNIIYQPTHIHFSNVGAYIGIGLRI